MLNWKERLYLWTVAIVPYIGHKKIVTIFTTTKIVNIIPHPHLPSTPPKKILLDFATFAVCPSVKIDRSVALKHSGNGSLIKTVLSPEGKGTIKVCLLAIKIKWKYQSLNCGKYRVLGVGSFAVYIY